MKLNRKEPIRINALYIIFQVFLLKLLTILSFICSFMFESVEKYIFFYEFQAY